ncbi:MAG: AAA family ATPase, partial [Chloroflexota bacterium]|nr:AAA family ATPase [Chloroflexota bacterium]
SLPVRAWRALRVVAERGGAGRAEQLEAPFVGRDGELRLIKELLHATGRELRVRLVSILGQAGIGKSRLAWEFRKYVDGLVETVYWHQGRSPAYGQGITFWALGEMVRSRARIAETDDARTTRQRLGECLVTHVADEAERRWIEPRLLALLGLEEAPVGGREELFAAWRTFFERIAALGTVVLVFEDLHWADPGLLDFIDHVLDWSRAHPMLIVTLARPELLEHRPDWGAGRRNFVALSLEPLPESEMRALLAGLVPGLPAPAVRTILARAEGVPLYAVETVRMLLQDGRLESVDGGYRPVGDLSRLQVPESLHAVIAARLDSLEPAERALLQDAAVLGQSFTVAGLAAVSGEPADVLEPRLRALVRRELLTVRTDPRSADRGQYAFVQSLIREVAYSTLARRDRRSRHLAAARFFEGLGEEELAGALASHYLDAYNAQPEGPEGDAVAVQARLALKAAADRATALGSYAQAVGYLDQALAVTRDPADEAAFLERAGASSLSAGHYGAAESYLTRAIARYRGVGDSAGAARATSELALALLSEGGVENAVEMLEAAHAELGHMVSEPAVVELTAAVGQAYMRANDHRRAIEWADRALEAAERIELIPVIVEALITRGTSLGAIGRLREATVILEGVVRLATARGLRRSELRARVNLAFTGIADDPKGTLETSRDGLELAQRLGEQNFVAILLGNAVESSFITGDWDWGVAALAEQESVELERVDRFMMATPAVLIRACRGESADGDLEQLETLAAGLKDPQITVTLAAARAWTALAAGRPDAAARHALDAVSPQYAADAYLLAARASLWLGDVDGARA